MDGEEHIEENNQYDAVGNEPAVPDLLQVVPDLESEVSYACQKYREVDRLDDEFLRRVRIKV